MTVTVCLDVLSTEWNVDGVKWCHAHICPTCTTTQILQGFYMAVPIKNLNCVMGGWMAYTSYSIQLPLRSNTHGHVLHQRCMFIIQFIDSLRWFTEKRLNGGILWCCTAFRILSTYRVYAVSLYNRVSIHLINNQRFASGPIAQLLPFLWGNKRRSDKIYQEIRQLLSIRDWRRLLMD